MTVLAVLSACTESRAEALRALQAEIVFYHGKNRYTLPYDPESQIVVLIDVEPDQFRLINTTCQRIRDAEADVEGRCPGPRERDVRRLSLLWLNKKPPSSG